MRRATFLSLLLTVLLAGSARADLLMFFYTLDGGQEVPPNASPATGVGTALFNDVTGEISLEGTFAGLTGGNASAAHLHGFSMPGVNSPPLFNLTFSAATSGTFSGNSTIAAGNIPSVVAGLTYVNIHNAQFPGGEIRGQLIEFIVIPEPAMAGLLAFGALGLIRIRRR